MCDWCLQHGEGKKWYLNIKNFSKDFLNDEAVVKAAKKYMRNAESIIGMGASMTPDFLNLKNDGDFSQAVEQVKQTIATSIPHRGQVVPIEDVKKIIELSGPIAKTACVCRRAFKGSFEEKTCIPVGPVYLEYAKEFPDYYRGGIDYISKEEAVELMEGFQEKGYVATFWMDFSEPAVIAFCNCEYPTCGGLRGRRFLGDWYNFFLRKAEYVVMHDQDKCIGCAKCIQRCQFSAITYSPYLEKAIFNMKECAGCGLCRDACEEGAIRLVPRSEVPAVRRSW
ncbi:MAG: 4Fe-4S binding protein [Candidatus Hodarchaeota archaeon]